MPPYWGVVVVAAAVVVVGDVFGGVVVVVGAADVVADGEVVGGVVAGEEEGAGLAQPLIINPLIRRRANEKNKTFFILPLCLLLM